MQGLCIIFPSLHILKSEQPFFQDEFPSGSLQELKTWNWIRVWKAPTEDGSGLRCEWKRWRWWGEWRQRSPREMNERARGGGLETGSRCKWRWQGVCVDAHGADEEVKGDPKPKSEGVGMIKRSTWDVGWWLCWRTVVEHEGYRAW